MSLSGHSDVEYPTLGKKSKLLRSIIKFIINIKHTLKVLVQNILSTAVVNCIRYTVYSIQLNKPYFKILLPIIHYILG